MEARPVKNRLRGVEDRLQGARAQDERLQRADRAAPVLELHPVAVQMLWLRKRLQRQGNRESNCRYIPRC